MTNSEINKNFLNSITYDEKEVILTSIAQHYGIDEEAIYDELIDEEAENILDYMVEPLRLKAYALMQKHLTT